MSGRDFRFLTRFEGSQERNRQADILYSRFDTLGRDTDQQ